MTTEGAVWGKKRTKGFTAEGVTAELAGGSRKGKCVIALSQNEEEEEANLEKKKKKF